MSAMNFTILLSKVVETTHMKLIFALLSTFAVTSQVTAQFVQPYGANYETGLATMQRPSPMPYGGNMAATNFPYPQAQNPFATPGGSSGLTQFVHPWQSFNPHISSNTFPSYGNMGPGSIPSMPPGFNGFAAQPGFNPNINNHHPSFQPWSTPGFNPNGYISPSNSQPSFHPVSGDSSFMHPPRPQPFVELKISSDGKVLGPQGIPLVESQPMSESGMMLFRGKLQWPMGVIPPGIIGSEIGNSGVRIAHDGGLHSPSRVPMTIGRGGELFGPGDIPVTLRGRDLVGPDGVILVMGINGRLLNNQGKDLEAKSGKYVLKDTKNSPPYLGVIPPQNNGPISPNFNQPQFPPPGRTTTGFYNGPTPEPDGINTFRGINGLVHNSRGAIMVFKDGKYVVEDPEKPVPIKGFSFGASGDTLTGPNGVPVEAGNPPIQGITLTADSKVMGSDGAPMGPPGSSIGYYSITVGKEGELRAANGMILTIGKGGKLLGPGNVPVKVWGDKILGPDGIELKNE